MAAPATFNQLSAVTGFKVAHLNIRSVVKKIDQLRLLLHDSKIDLFTLSETWLKPHLQSNIISLPGFTSLRLDRTVKGKGRKTSKRGGGLLMYVRNCHSSLSEHLLELNVSNKDIEAQWVLVHRPHCKNDLFLLGDLIVDFVNKSSVAYKSVNFCAQSNGSTQHIRTTTRNTDKSQTLIDIAFSNSKCVSGSGTLEHFISGHQPIFLIHKKSRDKRELVEFRGRSYRKFDRDQLKADQNKVLRCALNKGIETSSDELHSEAGLRKLKYRREHHLLNFMFDWSWDTKRQKASTGMNIKMRASEKRLLKIKKATHGEVQSEYCLQGSEEIE